jgi:mono/diheme cytochrome c family protein
MRFARQLGAVLLALALAAGVAQAQVAGDPERGGQLFVDNCAMCHGVDGKGRVGARLENFPGIQIEATLSQTIAQGVPGSVMPAWGQASGGPLSEQDIADIVAYITGAFGGTEPLAPLPTYVPPDIPRLPNVQGDPSAGAVVYHAECFACHGHEGQGRFGAPLAKDWPVTDPETYIRQVVTQGISGTIMPAWGTEAGGPLSVEQIADVAAYVLSLTPAVSSSTPTPAGQGPISLSTGLAVLGAVALLVIGALVLYYRRA